MILNNLYFCLKSYYGMKEIEQIYFNDFGVTFYWKKNEKVLKDRIQIVFKETGFYFSIPEIRQFCGIVNEMSSRSCSEFSMRNKCHKFLLKTPLNEIDLAVNQSELSNIKDLLEGTLFNIELFDYINDVCKN